MKKLFLILSVLFAASTFADELGRLKLVFPPGEWVTLHTKGSALKYTGAAVGQLDQQQTIRALIDKNKQLLAVVVIEGGGHGLGNVIMQYNDGCKRTNTEYVFDETGGSYNGLDCLRVWRSVATEPNIKRFAEAYSELMQMSLKLEANSYYVAHSMGTTNGTRTSVNALIAHSTLKNIPSAEQGAKYAGMPGVAYGHLLAKAVQASTRSLIGELVVPQIDYR